MMDEEARATNDTRPDKATIPPLDGNYTSGLCDAQITLLPNITKRGAFKPISLKDALESIKCGEYQGAVEHLRKLKAGGADGDAIKALKAGLPALIFSGLFSGQTNNKNFSKPSGLMVLDIDHLSRVGESPESIKHRLAGDNSIVAIFTSPGGDGVKVIVRVPEIKNDADNKAIFAKVEAYFHGRHKVKIDNSGKDVTRLCFVSYDEMMYINYQAGVLDLSGVESVLPGAPMPGLNIDDGAAIFEGGRNTTLHKIASKVRGQGGDFKEVLAAVAQANFERCKPQLDGQEVLTIVNSVLNYPTNAEKGERDGKTKLDLSEVGFAEYFRDSSEGRIRYIVENQQVVVWDDTNKQWKVDGTKEIVVKKVKEFLDRIQKLAGQKDE